MGFADAFARCMQNSGLQCDAQWFSDDAADLRAALDAVEGVYLQLDEVARQALEAISTSMDGATIFQEAFQLGGVEGLVAVITQSRDWPIASCLDYCRHCLESAELALAGSTPGADGGA